MKRKCESCGASWPADWWPYPECPRCESEDVYEEDEEWDK